MSATTVKTEMCAWGGIFLKPMLFGAEETMWENTLLVRTVLALLLIAAKHGPSSGLQITRVSVPSPMVSGEEGFLECDFELGDDSVYALKWYFGLQEFYRWAPAEFPPIKTFPVRGNPLLVDPTASDRGRVRIHDVKLGATGVFRCEVSAEAPSFHTEFAVATMTVLDLPDEKPRITGVRAAYQMHEYVRLNCSSPRSQPPATLSFYVNDEPAEVSWLTQYPPLEEPETGLATTVLGLHFPLRPHMLHEDQVVLKCTAAIEDQYWESSVVHVHSDVPYQAPITEGRSSGSPAGDRVSCWSVLAGGVVLMRLFALH